MLIKLRPDGLHWTKHPEGIRILAEERRRLDSRAEEFMEGIAQKFGLKWEEAEG